MEQDQDAPDQIRSARTFPSLLHEAARAFGDAPAIVLKTGTKPDESLSFAALERKSAEWAKALLALGVGKGSRIGFIFGNGPSFALALAAITRIGAVAIPLSTLLKANELIRVLRQSDIGGLILQRQLLGHDLVDRLCEALPELHAGGGPALRVARTPYLRWVVSSGPALPSAIRDESHLADLAETMSDELLQAAEAEVHPSDQMVEIYTSGSMALPKGVKHDHGPILFRTHYLSRMLQVERGQERGAFLPMFWVGGLMMSLMPHLAAGAVTICTEGTPTNSRAAMGSVLATDDLERLGVKPPYWALGMSETLGPYSYGDVLRAPGRPLCAPLDHIADGYEVRIADGAGQPVAAGEIGEIQVRGYPLTPRLHKIDPADCFEPDGFYRTGDLGLVEGGRIHFIGRDGDMIKSSGANVSPAEVEMEMQQLAGIHSAYVIGLPDRERGQRIVAAIVPRDGAVPDVAEIERQLRQKLSGYKVPRAYVLITRDEVPMLPSNKVARRQLEAALAQKLADGS